MYRYGDSSPFPLNDNFLETLRDVVDACVTLFQLDERVDELRQQLDAAERSSRQELASIDSLSHSLLGVLEPQLLLPGAGAVGIAARVRQSAESAVQQARVEAASRWDATVRELETALTQARAQVPRAVEGLLQRRCFSGSAARMAWKAGTTKRVPECYVYATTVFNLEALIDLDLTEHPLKRPIRVGSLDRDVCVYAPVPGVWFRRRARVRRVRLDDYYVTEVNLTPARRSMILRRRPDHTSAGFELVLGGEEQLVPTVTCIKTAMTMTEAMPLGDTDGMTVDALWSQVEASVKALYGPSMRVQSTAMDGDLPAAPGLLAGKMIAAVAPLVREIRRRSPAGASGELTLKRDVEAGRREEIYIRIEDLLARISTLPAGRRALFDALGLVPQPAESDVTEVTRSTGIPGPFDRAQSRLLS